MFTWGHIVLSLPKRAHVDWNRLFRGKKRSKNRLVCKIAVALAYYGSCRLLVMGSWFTSFVLTYQSFAYLCMVHCHKVWSLCWIQNTAPHHQTEGDWCKCGIAPAVQLLSSSASHTALAPVSIGAPSTINSRWKKMYFSELGRVLFVQINLFGTVDVL